MRKQVKKYLWTLVIIVCIILIGVFIYNKFFSSSKNDEYALLREKAEGEIVYLDTTIIELLNKLNNISYSRYDISMKQINENQQQSNNSKSSTSGESESNSKEGGEESGGGSSSSESSTEITNESEARTSRLEQTASLLNANYEDVKWNEISYSVETLYTAWPTVNIDMKTLNVQDDDLSSFSVTLDGVAQAIKAQDRNSALINLYNLYVLLPKFMSSFIDDKDKLNIYYAKAYVLNAYVSASGEKWNEMNANVGQAISALSNVMGNKDEKSNLQKAYVRLQDLEKATKLEDKQIFYLKYKLAIEELEIL